MIELVNKVATILAVYTSGELFVSNHENLVEITYHSHVMPPKEPSAEDAPFCWVHRGEFSVFPRPTVQVAASFLLFELDDGQAMDEAQRLAGLLDALKQPKQFSPWKLDAVTGYEGERETNLHPDSYRQYTYLLEFSGAR